MKDVLRDEQEQGTWIELRFLSHDAEPDEGSWLFVAFGRHDKTERESRFGWTNRVVHAFIHLLKHFPEEKYNSYFLHIEEDFFLRWVHERATDRYLLIFEYQGQLFPLKTSKSALLSWAEGLELSLLEASSK